MSAREYGSTADLQARVAELEARVAELEACAGRHDCLINVCALDSNGDCTLRPVGEVWGSPEGDEYDDAEVIQS